MSASPTSVLQSGNLRSVPHVHSSGESCPFCDQPIPHDRFDEIQARIQSRERERSEQVAAQLQARYAREKEEALAEAQQQAVAALEFEREQAASRVAAARNEERQATEVVAAERVAAAERASQEAQLQLQARIEQAEAAKKSAEENGLSLQMKLEQAKRDNEEAIEVITQEAAARESAIHAEAQQRAEADAQQKIATLQQTFEQSQAALQEQIAQAQASKLIAEEARASFQAQLEQELIEKETAIEQMKADAVAQAAAARKEATAVAEAGMQQRLTDAEQAKNEAEARAAAAAQQVASLQASHETQLAERLCEQREAFEKAQVDAVNAERAAAFDERLKLSGKVEDLQRALDKKTAEELGDMAEVDLYENLKAEFQDDRIERINKGQPGVDIRHVVIHNGKQCGTIIYDSKNHNAWRNEFVTKLANDQLAAKAEHAVLSTRKFPAGHHQLHVQDGVILASPARVVAIATVLRRDIIQANTLRLSNEERTHKTAKLYDFIRSDQAADIFARIDTHMEDLLELQVKEKKAHDNMWRKQGELFRSVQQVKGQLCYEIDAIIGTAGEPADSDDEENQS